MEKLKGIVLRTVKYGENGYIVDMFTNSRGRMSFDVKRSGSSQLVSKTSAAHSMSKSTRVTPSVILPLSLIEFESSIHGQNRITSARGIQPYHTFTSLHFNPVKASIVMFLSECLSNLLKEEAANPLLYQYIEDSLKWFDYAETGYANFHLVFLMRLTRFVGVFPNIDKHNLPNSLQPHAVLYYDLMNSEYLGSQPQHQHYLKPAEARTIPYLLYMDYENMHLYRMNRHQRNRCLEVIIEYYMLHLSGFREPKSLEVLQDVFG